MYLTPKQNVCCAAFLDMEIYTIDHPAAVSQDWVADLTKGQERGR